MRIHAIFVLSTYLLVSCTTQPSGTSKVLEPQLADAGRKDTLNCELKNGRSDNCVEQDGLPASVSRRPAKVEEQIVASNTTDYTGFEPWQCQQGPTAVLPVLGSMVSGRLKDLQSYCLALESGQSSQEPSQSYAEESGGGCEWKGKNYEIGTSIYYNEGPIMSADLKVNGQDFESLSGKPGPWQQCDCLSSSGHWGCV